MAKNKYNAKKCVFKGIEFDSRKEGVRYLELESMQKRGEISDLELQPEYLLQEKFQSYKNGKDVTIQPMHYTPDFRYRDKDGVLIVEEVKGMKTEPYRMRLKLFLYRYGDKLNFYEI